MVVALIRTNFDFTGLFAPYISGKSNPWGRGRIGGCLYFFFQLPAHHAGGGLRHYLGGLKKSTHAVLGACRLRAHAPMVSA